MECTIKREEKLIVEIHGRLDTVTSTELKDKLAEEDLTDCDIDLDFTDVEYISSAGLRLLVALQKQTKASGHQLVIRHINNVVNEIFHVAGFHKTLHIED